MGGTSFDRPLTMESILNAIYPVGSIYTSVQSTSPATLFGGTWSQIKGSFLYACEESGIVAGNTGGAKSVSYTPAGSNSGGSVGSHTLTIAEIPSHSHGLNSHTHSVGAHAHGLNGHYHGVGAHAHGLNSHTHSVGAHAHGLNSHTHTYGKASSTVAPTQTTTENTSIGFANGHVCLDFTSSGYIYYKSDSNQPKWTSNWQKKGLSFQAADASSNMVYGGCLYGSQNHNHGLNSHVHVVNSTSTNSGAASGSTANSAAFNSGAASGSTANSAAFNTGGPTVANQTTANTANSTAFNSGAASGNTASSGDGGRHNHGFTNPTFTGTAATIATMPPYLAVYMWKRTA